MISDICVIQRHRNSAKITVMEYRPSFRPSISWYRQAIRRGIDEAVRILFRAYTGYCKKRVTIHVGGSIVNAGYMSKYRGKAARQQSVYGL